MPPTPISLSEGGRTTTCGYDPSVLQVTQTTVYGYDHRDRLKTKATPQGTITYDYDDASGLLMGMHTNTPPTVRPPRTPTTNSAG